VTAPRQLPRGECAPNYSNKGGNPGIRDDIEAEYTAAKLNTQLGGAVKPIPVSAQITEFLDAKKRLEFLAQGKAAVAGGAK